MICPHCNTNTSLTSRQRSVSGGYILVILCSNCQKIVGVVNDPHDIGNIVTRAVRNN